jgi:hypothetical protein
MIPNWGAQCVALGNWVVLLGTDAVTALLLGSSSPEAGTHAPGTAVGAGARIEVDIGTGPNPALHVPWHTATSTATATGTPSGPKLPEFNMNAATRTVQDPSSQANRIHARTTITPLSPMVMLVPTHLLTASSTNQGVRRSSAAQGTPSSGPVPTCGNVNGFNVRCRSPYHG